LSYQNNDGAKLVYDCWFLVYRPAKTNPSFRFNQEASKKLASYSARHASSGVRLSKHDGLDFSELRTSFLAKNQQQPTKNQS
jgi:hypothetical protein